MLHLILTAMAMRLELLWQVGKLRLWELQWATQENSAAEQQIWAVTILCSPACAWGRHWACRGHWYSENKRKNAVSTDLCLGSPSQPGLCWHFEGLSLPFWLRTLPGVPIALSPSRCFNYLKLFLSKDRKVNSLSTPHLTYKMEIELLFFK